MNLVVLAFGVWAIGSLSFLVNGMPPKKDQNPEAVSVAQRLILEDYLPDQSMECTRKTDCPNSYGEYGICADMGFLKELGTKICWFKSTAPPTPEITRLQNILEEISDPDRIADTIHKIVQAPAVSRVNAGTNSIESSEFQDYHDNHTSDAIINSGQRTRSIFRTFRSFPRICIGNDGEASTNSACDEDWPRQRPNPKKENSAELHLEEESVAQINASRDQKDNSVQWALPPSNFFRCGVSCPRGVSQCEGTIGGIDYCWRGWCWYPEDQCDVIIINRYGGGLISRVDNYKTKFPY